MEKSEIKGGAVLLGCKPTTVCRIAKGFVKATSESQLVNAELGSSFTSFDNNNQYAPDEDLTVSIRNVCKSFKQKQVLSNLSMNVKKGTIYSLLGSSGCGKTTILSCIVGLMKWNAGEILLFGKKPNGTPGKRVGFMPQDIALHDQISIKETIQYYGCLYGMSAKDVEKQWFWLVEFLQLPSKFKLIKDLSGGQKRRVSLAVTLAHNPELLILDEPVGLDPLLRESIWKHLYNIVETRKATIIITTHYIEEARYSNTIGVMRKGRILAEDSPEALLEQHQCDLLEQVVLKLCRKDQHVLANTNNLSTADIIISDNKVKTRKSSSRKSSKNSYDVYEKFRESWKLESPRRPSNKSISQEACSSTIFDRVKAFSTVIWLIFLRHPVFMTMVLFLPTFQMILTLAALGTHPKDLKFGVINHDTLYFDDCFKMGDTNASQADLQTSCNLQDLSCVLIKELSKTGTLTPIPVQSAEMAREQVMRGEIRGFFVFPEKYSLHVANLILEHKFAENSTLDGSRVHLTMDMSDYLAASMAIRDVYQAYERYAMKLATFCELDPKEFQLPMMYRKPVYGKNDVTFTDYVIPIVILTVIFEIPMLITAIVFINDLKQGTLDRARVAGLRFKEVMISHLITQGSVIIVQTAICSVVLFFFYDFRVAGYYWQYFVLLVLGGICGEALGLLLGIIFKEEVEAVVFGMFLGPILLLYEGCLWPLEGMSKTVRYIAYTSPTTLMVESLRGIIYRGLGMLHKRVWPGGAMLIGWTVFFWVISITVFVRKQK